MIKAWHVRASLIEVFCQLLWLQFSNFPYIPIYNYQTPRRKRVVVYLHEAEHVLWNTNSVMHAEISCGKW